jgi:hypothetical protein
MYTATIVTSIAGGALSQWGMQQVWFLVRERRHPADGRAEASSVRLPPSRTIAEMWRTFREPGSAHSPSTVLYYYSTEALHFSELGH